MDETTTAVSKRTNDGWVRWWCPGCECTHRVATTPADPGYAPEPGAWDFNGDLDRPTLSPSVLVHGHRTLINPDLEGPALTAPENIRETPTCHSFIRDGRIEFLGDCTHPLAGTTVTMEKL